MLIRCLEQRWYTFTVCHNSVHSDLQLSTRMVMTTLSKTTTACHRRGETGGTSQSAKSFPSPGTRNGTIWKSLASNWEVLLSVIYILKGPKTFLMINSCMVAATQYSTLVRIKEYVLEIKVDAPIGVFLNISLHSKLPLTKVRPLIMCLEGLVGMRKKSQEGFCNVELVSL